MLNRGFFLLISRDDGLAQQVTELAQRYAVVIRACSLAEADIMLRRNRSWSGVLLDLDDGAAEPLASAKRLRETDVLVPVLAIATSSSAELINGVHALRMELVLKPADSGNFVSFLSRSLLIGWLPDERIAAWVAQRACTYKLTARDLQLVPYVLGNESRAQLMRRLRITDKALKTQVRSLLRKCRARTIDALAKTVLREALLMERGPSEHETACEQQPSQRRASESRRARSGYRPATRAHGGSTSPCLHGSRCGSAVALPVVGRRAPAPTSGGVPGRKRRPRRTGRRRAGSG
jgi:DNA-binding NarL/FixJ family response regulator